jgi:hypothetical protein
VSLPDLTDPTRGIVVQKPRADVYTWLLLVALIAIIIACTFLGMELNRYNWDYKAAGARATSIDYGVTAAARLA